MSKRSIIVLGLLVIAVTAMMGRSCTHKRITGPAWDIQRRKLVEELRRNGITDERVLDAMDRVPRHAFIPKLWRDMSYIDRPVSIGFGQTISQPFIVALMCQELKLKPTDRVLEIGTGSGYHAAVMSLLCRQVFTIEIIPELAMSAQRTLDSLGYRNVKVKIGDGYEGWTEFAPFDKIILTAAPEEVPQPLKRQMKVGGLLIAPVGAGWQKLVIIERTPRGYTQKPLLPVRFVPMTGRAQEKK